MVRLLTKSYMRLAFVAIAAIVILTVWTLQADTEPPEVDETIVVELDESTQIVEEAPVDTAIADVVDTEVGRSLSASCTACHGNDGNALQAENSNLAGQNEKYLFRQLQMIQSEEREIVVMKGLLNAFDDGDLRNIAAYYASLPGRIGQSNPEGLEEGEAIYRGGILEKKVAACTACHAPNGNGNMLAGFPRVSGQTVEYTVAQLKAYREQERTTDEDYGGMMRDIAARLTDSEIEALANYMTGLY
ncbi:MAG: c-type cytochrome [Gammaproteobacteria bacterium]|nr:c-type cytochrome [Gammaproteobacteria bacterium]